MPKHQFGRENRPLAKRSGGTCPKTSLASLSSLSALPQTGSEIATSLLKSCGIWSSRVFRACFVGSELACIGFCSIGCGKQLGAFSVGLRLVYDGGCPYRGYTSMAKAIN